MEKETLWILERVKNGEMSIQTAQRQIFVLLNLRKSSICRLDRLPKDCCIIQHTSFKKCEDCGHFIKD